LGSRKKRTNLKVVIVAIAAIVVLAMGAVSVATFSGANTAAKFGGLNSAHEHAAFVVELDGVWINFAQQKYQVKSPYIHVENGVGTTLHKHATQVPFGEFLKSVGMNIVNGCFVMDDGKQYCDTAQKRLRFFVNGIPQPASSIMGYVLNDNDHFLVIYGDETAAELQREIGKVQVIQIAKPQLG
jgi:hypothetical protein